MRKEAWWVAGVVAVLLLILALGYSRRTPSPQENTGGAPPKEESPASATTTPPASVGAPRPSDQQLPAKQAISILSPKTGEGWVLGKNQEIAWSRAAGETGGMYLVDSLSGTIVGWIHSSLGINQTSYTWDAKTIFLARSSPSKKEIGVGSYFIKMIFDGRQPPVEGAKFSIIYPGQVKIPTHSASVQNGFLNPATITVKGGDLVTFTNNDPAEYKIRIGNVTPFTLPRGDAFTFNTSLFTPGSYPIVSEAIPSLKGTLLVQ